MKKDVVRSVRLPDDLYEQVAAIAKRDDRKISDMIIHLVRLGYERYEKRMQIAIEHERAEERGDLEKKSG
jgi:metal-responsive CopG/Arc/MetJ family transcriptional regulator